AEEIADFAEAYRKGAQSDGHGLGLSVCYELARDNGMELSCASRRNEGTVFMLAIPMLEHLEAA
ncbi:MAG: ATP-binding protein, partial [Pseudomonadota bacterium]